MSPAQTAAHALSNALRLFETQESELAEKERQLRVLAEQLEDALDEVAALRAQLVATEMTAPGRGALGG